MIPTAIFTLLLLTLLSFHRKRSDLGRVLFTVSLVATLLLFLHHVTDPLGLSF